MTSLRGMRRTEEESTAADASLIVDLTPEERAAVFVGLTRTMDAVLADLSAEERRRRRESARAIDPLPRPWWKNLRRAAWPDHHA